MRREERGASAKWGAMGNGVHGLLEASAEVNPMIYNWNKVYVGYRDGASFGGATTTMMGRWRSRDIDIQECAGMR